MVDIRDEFNNFNNTYGLAYGQNDSWKLYVEVWRKSTDIAPNDPANDSPGLERVELFTDVNPRIFKRTIYRMVLKYRFPEVVDKDEPMTRS